MFKKITLALVAASFAVIGTAQSNEFEYRRSSLSMIMLDNNDKSLTGDIKKAVVTAFNEKAIPAKFNDHNLTDLRSINTKNLPDVTKEEIAKYETKMEAAIAKGAEAAKKAGINLPAKSQAKYIAQLMKYFEQNHTANKMIAKWFNVSKEARDGAYLDMKLVEERGFSGFTAEKKAEMLKLEGGKNKLADAAILDMVPRTFLVVTRYEFLSAQEIVAMLVAPAQLAVAMAAEKAAAAGNNPLAQKALDLAKAKAAKEIEVQAAKIQGYFVSTNTYLFQLEWNNEIFEKFGALDWTKAETVDQFMKDGSYKVNFVGQTSKYAPAGMTASKDDKSIELVKRALNRSTDAAIGKLQLEYDVFKTLAPVYAEGEDVYAQIGVNEGVTEESKFEIVELIADAEGNITFKKKQKATVLPGKVWDNREGAGVAIEGEAKMDDGVKADPSLKGTYLKAKAKKIVSGMQYVRQAK